MLISIFHEKNRFMPIFQMWLMAYGREASDARNKIFALICPNAAIDRAIIDYEADVSFLFKSLALAGILQTVDFLSTVHASNVT